MPPESDQILKKVWGSIKERSHRKKAKFIRIISSERGDGRLPNLSMADMIFRKGVRRKKYSVFSEGFDLYC